MKIQIINGPNLNLLGSREKEIYGDKSLMDLEEYLVSQNPKVSFSFFQSNIEGEIIYYNCIFQWSKGRYNFKTCELIEGATWRQRIKPEFKDSVSNDIRNTLVKNEMIL